MRATFVIAAIFLANDIAAQDVSMSGSMGDKALLIIDGGGPRAVAAGSTLKGVKVISVAGSQAVVEIGGKRRTLVLGAAPVNAGGGRQADAAARIVLPVGRGGHFVSTGSINGHTVRFMVDTGATSVALSQAEADRIGLDYHKGKRLFIRTANGRVTAHRITLAMVRLGEVKVYNVRAVVTPAPMEMVLLGNSFLSRFEMKRESDRMTLQRRY